jgi:undecaprenyl-diphosphatase
MLAYLALFVILTILVKEHVTDGFDQLFLTLTKHQPKTLKHVMKAIGNIAFPVYELYASLIISALAVMILAAKDTLLKYLRDVTFFAGNAILAFIANKALKPLLGRIGPSGKFSFPSDHAMMAFAFFIPLTFIICKHLRKKTLRRLIWFVSIICTFGIGFSRVYLQKHYMTDILGAYLFNGFLFFVLFLFTQYPKPKGLT